MRRTRGVERGLENGAEVGVAITNRCRQVSPGAEATARPGEQQSAAVLVSSGVLHGVAQCHMQRAIEHVQLVRPVECDDAIAVADVDKDGVHLSPPSVSARMRRERTEGHTWRARPWALGDLWSWLHTLRRGPIQPSAGEGAV